MIVEAVLLGPCHDLDISDCVVVEEIPVHMAIVLHIACQKLAYDRGMHWLRWER